MKEEPVVGREYRLRDGRVVHVLTVDRWRVRVSVYEDEDSDCNYVTYIPREDFDEFIET